MFTRPGIPIHRAGQPQIINRPTTNCLPTSVELKVLGAVGMMTFPILMESQKNYVPKHQPVLHVHVKVYRERERKKKIDR